MNRQWLPAWVWIALLVFCPPLWALLIVLRFAVVFLVLWTISVAGFAVFASYIINTPDPPQLTWADLKLMQEARR